jgi:hypothetical protein
MKTTTLFPTLECEPKPRVTFANVSGERPLVVRTDNLYRATRQISPYCNLSSWLHHHTPKSINPSKPPGTATSSRCTSSFSPKETDKRGFTGLQQIVSQDPTFHLKRISFVTEATMLHRFHNGRHPTRTPIRSMEYVGNNTRT